jgi:hypothetical protein
MAQGEMNTSVVTRSKIDDCRKRLYFGEKLKENEFDKLSDRL